MFPLVVKKSSPVSNNGKTPTEKNLNLQKGYDSHLDFFVANSFEPVYLKELWKFKPGQLTKFVLFQDDSAIN